MGKDKQGEICFANLQAGKGGKYVKKMLRDFRSANRIVEWNESPDFLSTINGTALAVEHFTRSSQRSKLASLLANRSDTLIMLTATPHDRKGQSVASLMNMLDPTAIADEENYTKDDIQGLLIRRFKKDIQDQVSGAFKERVITIERCVRTIELVQAYSRFIQ